MQKLDVLRNTYVISKQLNAAKISQGLQGGLDASSRSGDPHDFRFVLPLLISAKSNYDNLIKEEEKKPILSLFRCESIYATEQFATLISVLSVKMPLVHMLQNPYFLNTMFVHEEIVKVNALCHDLLLPDGSVQNYVLDKSEHLVFQISQVGSISLEELAKIFRLLSEIIEMLSEVYQTKESFQKPQVVLLDSGSPLSVGVKTAVDVVEAVNRLFKEIFFFWVTFKHHKNGVEMESFVKNLSVLKDIKNAETKKVLTPEKAKAYSVLIERKTDELIGLKVLPKQILEITATFNSSQLLQQFESTRLLQGPLAAPDQPLVDGQNTSIIGSSPLISLLPPT